MFSFSSHGICFVNAPAEQPEKERNCAFKDLLMLIYQCDNN